jgi:citrate synthase
MMSGNSCEEYKVHDVLVRTLDRILILQGDHEQNASTSTVHFIRQITDEQSSIKSMGFGHRIYQNDDTRTPLMRETCHEVMVEPGLVDDPLFELSMKLEQIALEGDACRSELQDRSATLTFLWSNAAKCFALGSAPLTK